MDAGQYLTTSYYEHWLTGAATVAVEHGMVTPEELERAAGGAFPLSGRARAEPIDDPGPDRQQHRFAVGDQVRVKDWHPQGHTRCPRYVRGHRGIVVRLDASASVPDIEAHSGWRHREPTYSIGFEASELWRDGQAGATVQVDLWESYLEAVAS
jgi:nitrile hydratase